MYDMHIQYAFICTYVCMYVDFCEALRLELTIASPEPGSVRGRTGALPRIIVHRSTNQPQPSLFGRLLL